MKGTKKNNLSFIGKWNLNVLSLFSRVQLSVTLWTVADQAPLSIGFLKLEWVATPSSRGSS